MQKLKGALKILLLLTTNKLYGYLLGLLYGLVPDIYNKNKTKK